MNDHAAALQAQLDAALAAISASADASRRAIDGDIDALGALAHAGRPAPLDGVPVDERPPSLMPLPSAAVNALIPDSPLIETPAAPAFDDDAPLWQS